MSASRRRFVALAAMLVVALFAGCSDSATPESTNAPSSTSGAAVPSLQAVVTQVAVPGYRALSTAADELEAAIAPCTGPVDRAQDAWRKTRIAWDRASVFRFGPQTERLLPALIDYWPSTPDAVEEFAAKPGPIGVDDVGSLGSGAAGLPALEQLLFSNAPLTGRRCEYARQLAANMARGAADVADLWENDASRFASDSRALADLVSALADAVYLIADTELAMPAGSRAGTSPDPKLVRGRAGAMSLEDAQTQLDAIKAAHLAGVAPILDARSPEAAASINTALDAARAALSAIPGDLQGAVVTQREVVLAAAEACRQVQRTYATQVAGSLGLTLNVPAGDGD